MGARLAFLVLLFLPPAFGQSLPPEISEFVAVNAASRIDGNGNTPDWIEIHNPNPTPLDISGYHLTDDPELPTRYTFPAGTIIPAGGYRLVFASARTEPAYVDPGGFLHTTFSLDGNGEYLALNAPNGSVIRKFEPYPVQFEDVSYGIRNAAPETTVLIPPAASAKWQVPAAPAGNAWQMPAFDDAAWTAATTGIGYGYDTTLIGPGGDTRNAMWFVNASVRLRIPFTVTNPAGVSALTLKMRYEDGFVAYLNGTRVAAANAPDEAALSFDSTATAVHPNAEAAVAESFVLSPAALVTGANVLAIQGLNLSASGTDSTDFLLLPELTAAAGSTPGGFGYFTKPTPGAANGTDALLGFVEDTKFSHNRGYYTTPFSVTISTATPGATIYYTTDGTPPSATRGTLYTAPVPVSATTTLRALAVKTGYQPTNVDTQTYLFVGSIVRQTRPPSYPTTWGGAKADYDMDAQVVDNPVYADKFGAAFAALPSLSLVFDPDALFHPVTGIYQQPAGEGDAWERPLSAELIVPDNSEPGFQINAGVRIQGGSSRSTDTPKHSLSLRFSAEYGAGKLNYPLYKNTPGGKTAVDSFDLLQLRPEYNFGWMHRHWYQCLYALYGRDQWASDLFNAMGQTGSHGRWVHLFLNGIYWGLYDVQERPDADFMASYFGGTDADYDTVNSSVATAGDLNAFNTMMDLAYGTISTPATYASIQSWLNVDAFIDYMILNAYVGNRDWDGHNWRAGRKREAGAGYLFVPWDTEFAVSHVPGGAFASPPDFFSTTLATNVTAMNGSRRPTGLQNRLETNAEYRLRYADHIRRHFFNGGALTPAKAAAAWTARSGAMFHAIVAESARWGDFRRDESPGQWASSQFALYTRDQHYLPTLAWLQNTYIPQRTNIVLGQLRARNLYPATAAPDFSQHGGTIPRGFNLQITAPAAIYYTTDRSDPRLTGGAINSTASSLTTGGSLTLNQSTLVKARTRSAGGEWSALTEAFFAVAAEGLRISEIMYHPADPDPLAEFIELHNAGTLPVFLTGLRFTAGISFNFDLHSSILSLAPGARLLIVRDPAAFRAVHGNTLDPLIAGTFQDLSALANDGETLTISDANDLTVITLTYNDKGAWPAEADGQGRSLVFTGGNAAQPLQWRPSATASGNPGSSDATPYSTGPLLDYVFTAPPAISMVADGVTLTLTTRLTADAVTLTLQQSPDLTQWTPVTNPMLGQRLNADGTRTITAPLPPGTSGFVRVLVTLQP